LLNSVEFQNCIPVNDCQPSETIMPTHLWKSHGGVDYRSNMNGELEGLSSSVGIHLHFDDQEHIGFQRIYSNETFCEYS